MAVGNRAEAPILARLARDIVNLPLCLVYFVYHLGFLALLCARKDEVARRIFRDREDREIEKRIETMKSFVGKGDRVLDVGAGKGVMGERLQRDLGVEVVGVDVVDYADAEIPIHPYDGKRLPFEDRSFDVVFLSFVLHHTDDHDSLMNEVIRCTHKKIMILEDTYTSPWERLFITWNDYFTNILQGHVKVWKGFERPGVTSMPMPFTFRSVRGWLKYFRQFPVRVESCSLRLGLKPHKKITFLLERG